MSTGLLPTDRCVKTRADRATGESDLGGVIRSQYLTTGLNASFTVTVGSLRCSTCCRTGSGAG